MSGLNGDWYEALKGEFSKPYYRKLFETVNEEYRTKLIFPPAQDIFNAFHLTPLKDVKVVILGQDPYHNNGQAHGLSFSVQKGVDIPPSLVNLSLIHIQMCIRDSDVTDMANRNYIIDGKSLMGLMSIKLGLPMRVVVNGQDEEEANECFSNYEFE